MVTKKIKKLGILSVLAFPMTVFAAPRTVGDLLNSIVSITDVVVPILITAALAAFLIGLVQTLFSAGDTKKYAEGGKIMTYGIISLFVVVAIWGIMAVAHQTIFGIEGEAKVDSGMIESIYSNI